MKNVTPRLYEAILERVRIKMQEQKLTQAEIGSALGIKQSAVSYLLKGKTKLSLEQFLELTALVGESPQQLIAEAESGLTERRPMPADKEKVLSKSIVHFVCYCSANRQVTADEIANSVFPLASVRVALDDLVKIDLLSKNANGKYVQKHVNISYMAPTAADRYKRDQYQLEIHRICQELWRKQVDNKAYRANRFNYLLIEYFTQSQMREVEEFLWRAHQKLRGFQRQNMASGYNAGGEKFSLWQAHMMLMTPLEEK
ncbi:MAG: helix-turn-helix domain-containing protein [Oligoflexia bacterium]|nr:helix-turn-helix domain-containing protein [Oligoflexia bacterium]